MCVLLIALSPIAAFSQSETPQPFVFKGAQLGMTLEAFRAKFAGDEERVRFSQIVGKHKQVARWVTVPSPYCEDTVEGKAALLQSQGLQDDGVDWIHGMVCGVSERQSVAAGIPLEMLLFKFNGGKLSGILFVYESSGFANVSSGFAEKYGAGTEVSAVEYQNIFGAKWSGNVLRWKQGTQQIVLTEGSDQVAWWTKGIPGFGALYDETLFDKPKPVPKDF
jgi:hypothetical protein